MPIYEYRCEACRHEFEKLVLSGPAGSVFCPHCGSDEASRLASTFGMIRGGVPSLRTAESFSRASAPCCAGGGCACRH